MTFESKMNMVLIVILLLVILSVAGGLVFVMQDLGDKFGDRNSNDNTNSLTITSTSQTNNTLTVSITSFGEVDFVEIRNEEGRITAINEPNTEVSIDLSEHERIIIREWTDGSIIASRVIN